MTVYKVSKVRMLEAMLDELMSALENDNSYILNGMWYNLFDLDRDEFKYSDSKDITIETPDKGSVKMRSDQVDEFISDMAWKVCQDVGKGSSNENGSFFLLIEDESE
tara:strand:+ start:661 stop:981 length:321 start_codon:yes stop_codon:yes gene_type:complete